MSAEVGDPGADVYTATKGAIRSFCYSLRQSEANQQGLKVSLIEPGQVGTDMQSSTAEEQRQQIEQLETLAAEDIAESIIYCLTQPARSDVVWVQIRPHGQAI
jgi:NADP-dependent 3-hydroxy acid dehydrogenase YdfG